LAQSVAFRTLVRGWFDSVYGGQRGHRASVLGQPNIMVTGSADHHAYVNLPEEVDAYATQYALEAILDPLLTATTQTAVDSSPSAATLIQGHRDAAKPGPKTFADQLQLQTKKLQHTGGRSDKVADLAAQHHTFADQDKLTKTSRAPGLVLGTSVKDLAAQHKAAAKESALGSGAEERSRDRIQSLAALLAKH
jgi:hypothetical protein